MTSIRAHLAKPVVFTVGHMVLGAVFMGLMFGTVVYVSHLNRESLLKEREARVQAEFKAIHRQILTDGQIATIAQTQARLASPTDQEIARRSRQALNACSRSMACRQRFTQVVSRVLRIENGRFVPAPGGRGIDNRRPAPGVPSPQGEQRPPKVVTIPGPKGMDGRPGRDGVAGKDIDSAALARVDTTLAALEQGLAGLGGQVQGIVSALCVPALRPLLGVLRLCR